MYVLCEVGEEKRIIKSSVEQESLVSNEVLAELWVELDLVGK